MKTIDIPTDNPLEMIWAVREKIYEETKDMTKEEFGRLLQQHSEAFEKKLEKARAERLARAERSEAEEATDPRWSTSANESNFIRGSIKHL